MMGKASKSFLKSQKGQALLIVMLVMLFSGLVLPPLLSYTTSALKTGRDVFEEGTYLSYAADAGVEDGLWQVKTKNLPDLFPNYKQYGYYDYSTAYQWSYDLSDRYGATGIVNGEVVGVTFQNVWMPKDIPAPSLAEAEYIANEGNLVVYGSLSGASGTEYQIKMLYYWDSNPGDPDYDLNGQNLRVQSLGIWLPPGFAYTAGSFAGAPPGYTPSEDIGPYKGGSGVVWNFPSTSNYPKLVDFPNSTTSTNPIVRTITFQFTGPTGRTPGTALAWMTTTPLGDISYSWDSSVRLYKIISEATHVAEKPGEEDKTFTVEAYAATTEALKRGAAISGDYCAIGGTLLTTTTDQLYRDKLFKDSHGTIQSDNPDAAFYIPHNAHVVLAYLYWSGWLESTGLIWGDDCSDFSDWILDSDWTIYQSSEFRGHHGAGTRNLAMNRDIDLSSYAGQTVTVSWTQWTGSSNTSSDGLDFEFSNDSGQSWSAPLNPPNGALRGRHQSASTFTFTIPSNYKNDKFRMRFVLVGCASSGRYVYIDDISIYVTYGLGSIVGDAHANQIRFNGTNLTAAPADIQTKVVGGYGSNSLYYSCKYDVTSMVVGNGVGTYTVGHVLGCSGPYQMYDYDTGQPAGTTAYPLATPAYKDDQGQWVTATQYSYAAWSLVVVYSSPETQGHQLYLYEDFTSAQMSAIDLDGGSTTSGWTIGGFIAPDAIKKEGHAAHLTCFVGDGDEYYDGDYVSCNSVKLWDGTTSKSNSQSNPNNAWNSKSFGMAQSGIDIDTFTIAYPTIQPGDVSAHMYMPVDEYVTLVYIILSFRSDIVPASTVSYLVK
jgi:hypothetical protein